MIDAADAYVRLYDVLYRCPGGLLDDWWDQGVEQLATQVSAEVQATGHLPDERMPDPLEPGFEAWGALLGLDYALRGADDSLGALTWKVFSHLRFRLRLHGRLNDETDGRLLFRRARAGRPNGLNSIDEFLHLLRIPAHLSTHIDIERVREVDDLTDPGYGSHTDPGPLPTVQIAQLPLLAEPDDLDWGVRNGSYHAGPKATLIDHLPAALEALEAGGAEIGFLPEASLNDAMVEEWRNLLVNTPPPADSRLTWLLIGSGPVTCVGTRPTANRPTNRAVLLHRNGDVLLTHDKQRGFTFTKTQQQESGIDLGGTRTEYLAQGTDITLLESSYGRIGILICEDLDWHDVRGDVIAAGVTHLLVPVLAPAMWRKGWQEKAAMILVKEAGTTTAVGNGLAINRYVPERYAPPQTPAPTLMVFTCPDDCHDEWPSDDDLITAYVCAIPASGIDARADALTIRGPAAW